MTSSELLQFCLSVTLMAVTIFIPAKLVLKVTGWPVAEALIIAFTSNALGKLFVSVLHLPAVISYSLPTLAFFGLSILFFRPKFWRLVVYWLVGFAIYLAIHIFLSLVLGWNFMFPFWNLRR